LWFRLSKKGEASIREREKEMQRSFGRQASRPPGHASHTVHATSCLPFPHARGRDAGSSLSGIRIHIQLLRALTPSSELDVLQFLCSAPAHWGGRQQASPRHDHPAVRHRISPAGPGDLSIYLSRAWPPAASMQCRGRHLWSTWPVGSEPEPFTG